MIKLKDLKVNEQYYIVGENGCYDDVIIKFKVLNKLKGGQKNGFVSAKFLKYMYDQGEMDVQYYNDEDVIEELYINDEEKLFKISDVGEAQEYLEYVTVEHELSRRLFELDNYIPEHKYPDWDGDESIMYYLDHYKEEDEDEEDYDDYEDE